MAVIKTFVYVALALAGGVQAGSSLGRAGPSAAELAAAAEIEAKQKKVDKPEQIQADLVAEALRLQPAAWRGDLIAEARMLEIGREMEDLRRKVAKSKQERVRKAKAWANWVSFRRTLPELLRRREIKRLKEEDAKEAEAQALLAQQEEAKEDKKWGLITGAGSLFIAKAMHDTDIANRIDSLGLGVRWYEVYMYAFMLFAFASHAPVIARPLLGNGARWLQQKLGQAELATLCVYIAIEAVKHGWEKYGAQLGM